MNYDTKLTEDFSGLDQDKFYKEEIGLKNIELDIYLKINVTDIGDVLDCESDN
jgi:hypothetical protein